MQDNLKIVYGKALSETELEHIEKGFSKIALQARGLPPIEGFCITIYADAQLVAAICGSMYYGCMDIDTLFVDETFRHKGYGRQLMQKAEQLAQQKSCTLITLRTMDWEARGFYEKLGYQFEYERAGYMNGAVLYALKKDLV